MKEKIKTELQLLWNTQAQSQNGKRKLYLDFARSIAIILVVAGHSTFTNPYIHVLISTFHLPAFFVISGWLMQDKQEEKLPFKTIFLRKIRSIFIPYVMFSFLTLLLDVLHILRGHFTWKLLIEHTLQTILLLGYSVMWFLPVLLLTELLVILLLKVIHHLPFKKMTMLLILYAFILISAHTAYYGYIAYGEHISLLGYQTYSDYASSFANFDYSNMTLQKFLIQESRILIKVLIASFFMITGYIAGTIITKKENSEEQPFAKHFCFRPMELILGLLLISVNIFASFRIQVFDLNFLNLGSISFYFILGTTGTLGLLLICRNLPNIALLTFFGQNSLIIMCTHLSFYILYIGQLSSFYLAGFLPGDDISVIAILSIILTMFYEIFVILIIRIFFPFVLGKKNSK